MTRLRVLVVALLLVTSVGVIPVAFGDVGSTVGASETTSASSGPAAADHAPEAHDRAATATPSTDEPLGTVNGVRHDDTLSVDDREDAALSEAELETVVYRSMARIEHIREQPFEEVPDVDVISREEFEAENEELFVDVADSDELLENVRYEALFLLDRETSATDAFEALYAGSVGGYYDPASDEIVLVADDSEGLAVDEIVLGHELLHAMQDQRFGIERDPTASHDEQTARTGLIEGEAVWVETEYDARCEEEWSCLPPETGSAGSPGSYDRGLFFTVFHPYSDGPDYVDSLLDSGGWDAVDDAFDDPPRSSAEVIRPGESRALVDVDLEDRSSERWEPVVAEDGSDATTFGEAAMASPFMSRALEGDDAVLEPGDVFDSSNGPYSYDHDVTDGWAGDELLAYATDAETPEESGFVWESRWVSEDDAGQFLEGYRTLIEAEGGEAVDGDTATYEIDDESGFPGAYALEHDGETVTIVRAPSVDELDELREGAGPDDETATTEGDGSEDDSGDEADDGTDENAVSSGVVIVAVALVAALLAVRR